MIAREFQMADIFGSFLAEGARAAAFRLHDIEPTLETNQSIVLDFSGVHNVNSSFANALLAPLIELHGEGILDKFRFRHCNAIVKVMIESALSLGVERSQGQRPKASA